MIVQPKGVLGLARISPRRQELEQDLNPAYVQEVLKPLR